MKTARVFTEKVGFTVNESTVRGMKKAHVSKKRTLEDDCVQSLPKRTRGVREAGGVINVMIVMALYFKNTSTLLFCLVKTVTSQQQVLPSSGGM